MRIVATSDLHGSLPEIPECDLLLIGGDVCPDFLGPISGGAGYDAPDRGAGRQANWLNSDFREWLDRIPAKQVVGIAGNHDFVFEHQFLVPRNLRWVYLEDNTVNVGGVRIAGVPWVPNLPFWAFHATAPAMRLAFENVEPCDILLSHGPPYTILDEAPAKYGSAAGEHVGSTSAVNAMKRVRPSYFICGHIHEGYGHEEFNYKQNTVDVFNVAHMNGEYEPVNAPVVLDL